MPGVGTIAVPAALSDRELSLEALLALGARVEIGGKLLPPLVPGHFVLFQTLRSPFIPPVRPWTEKDTREAVAVILHGRNAVQPIFESLNGFPKKWDRILRKASRLVGPANWELVSQQLIAQIQYSKGGGECAAWEKDPPPAVSDRFDAVWLAHVVGAVAMAVPGVDPDTVVWETPMVLTGFYGLVCAVKSGANVKRPLDIAAGLAALAELEET